MAGIGILTKKRLLFLLTGFTLALLLLVVRVAWIQVVQGADLQKKAFEQQNLGLIISPKRGTIYDRNGKELAINASVETIAVNPKEIASTQTELVAQGLSEILGMNKDDVLKKLKKNSRYEIIKKKIDKDIGDKIRSWSADNKVSGVKIYEDSKRYYPDANLAAHVIGFTGSDNQGLDGIEKVMEQYLKGIPGKILNEVDAAGREVPFNNEKHIDPQDGYNVVLTIDETIQHIADNAITKAMDDNKVTEGATAIVLDPRNGDILALVSKPDFDLNTPYAAPAGVDPSTWNGNTNADVKKLYETVWRDKAVADTYEPGSTFKAITSAAALEEGVVTPETRVTDATIIVGGWPINCWKPNAHLNESFTEGVYNSCNPVFVRVAQSLGVSRFYKYVRAFGFYEPTSLGLPGEALGLIHKKPTETNMAAASFGQRFTITPVQLITAYGAVANGGNLMKPRLVKELTDSDGNVVKKYEPEVVRNVISKQTSDTLKKILEGVVSEGTGANAYVTGYRVAGKTGTSETVQTPKTGRYIASFSAFAPADNPVICVLVVLDHPNVYPHSGGWIAAPVAGKIVEDTLTYLGVDRRYTAKDAALMLREVYVPPVTGLTLSDAEKALRDKGLEYRIEGDGNNKDVTIMEQTPKADARVSEKSVIILYTYKPQKENTVKVPDLQNKTVSEATQTLLNIGLNIKVEGLGNVVNQDIKAGTAVPKGQIIITQFKQSYTE